MFKKAERQAAPLKIAITGPSFSIKTYSMLMLARGICGPDGRIAVVDTENSSASLYADVTDFDVVNIRPPFTAVKYIEAINAAIDGGYDVLCIDSLSHEWSSVGGVLAYKDELDLIKDMWGNWGIAKKDHNILLYEVILQAPIDTIVTMRSKMKYELQSENGKMAPKKIGLEPIQQPEIEYEFGIVLTGDAHTHEASVSKDRTRLWEGRPSFKVTEKDGETLARWRDEGGAFVLDIQPETRKRVNKLIKALGWTKENWMQNSIGILEEIEAVGITTTADLTEEQGVAYADALAKLNKGDK